MKVLVFLLLLIPVVGYSQFNVKYVADTNTYNLNIYRFPILTDKTVSAQRINNFLQLNELYLLVGKEDSTIFERNWPTKEDFHGRQIINPNVIVNNGQILSLSFFSEWCAAYCESTMGYYLFDSQNGNSVALQDLFTPNGYELIKKMVILHNEQLLVDEIRQTYENEYNTHAEIKTEKRIEYLESLEQSLSISKEERDLYEDCISKISKYKFFSQFYVDSSKLVIIRERCSNHGMRALDNIDEFVFQIPLLKVIPILSEYGQQLLTDNTINTKSKSTIGKVYTGFIGKKYPITMILNRLDDHSVGGWYAYDKSGQGISLTGDFHDGIYNMQESDINWDTTGYLKFRIDDTGKLTGTWTSPKGTELSLELKSN